MKLALILGLSWAAYGCQTVPGDRILGKDLAEANPVFSTLDPALALGPAPMAGVRRVLHAPELLALARQNGILPPAPLGELCFERATEPLTVERLAPLLESALGIDHARIEILDYSRFGVPQGALEFTRAGLSPAGLWRGHVAYAEGRTAPIWARVRITTEQTWVEAWKPLAAGKLIDADGVALRRGPRSPFAPAPLDSVELVTGKTPLRAIPPGTPIFQSTLIAPREVERGDQVMVQVSSGGAWLSFDATAESPGRAGESILIRNPENGRLFQARIEAKGKVAVKR